MVEHFSKFGGGGLTSDFNLTGRAKEILLVSLSGKSWGGL